MVGGRSPITVAAAAIYVTVQRLCEGKSLKEVAKVTGVASKTILETCKELNIYSKL